MLGAIIGDIVGSIYEFDNIKTKDFELFDRECFFTDDTVMSVAVAEALLDTQPDDRENAIKKAALKSESKNLEAKGEILKGILEGETKGKDYPESIIDELGEEAVASKKRIAEIKPTAENIKSYLDTAKTVEEGKNIQEFKKRNAQRRAQYAEDTKKRAQDALKKAEAERQAKADIKTRIITNINKWGETNG